MTHAMPDEARAYLSATLSFYPACSLSWKDTCARCDADNDDMCDRTAAKRITEMAAAMQPAPHEWRAALRDAFLAICGC